MSSKEKLIEFIKNLTDEEAEGLIYEIAESCLPNQT
jgi:hypothetical protein